jgi:hypothetical protein
MQLLPFIPSVVKNLCLVDLEVREFTLRDRELEIPCIVSTQVEWKDDAGYYTEDNTMLNRLMLWHVDGYQKLIRWKIVMELMDIAD